MEIFDPVMGLGCSLLNRGDLDSKAPKTVNRILVYLNCPFKPESWMS